jgi:hypothetical protein
VCQWAPDETVSSDEKAVQGGKMPLAGSRTLSTSLCVYATSCLRAHLAQGSGHKVASHGEHGDDDARGLSGRSGILGSPGSRSRGSNVAKIQRRAGHDGISTTMGYVKVAEDISGDLGEPFPSLPQSLLEPDAARPPPPIGPRFGPST